MNDRPTPETDAEHAQFKMGGFTLDFCRKLERERDEAQEDATNYYAKIGELKQERDQAREAAAKWEFDAMERAGAEQARRADENREWALKAERERDEAREALENHTASTTHSCHDQCQRPMCVLRRELDKERERAKELAELVDGSYIFVELHKPDCEYNKKWRVAWMEKAKRLIPGVDSIWY